MNAYRKIDTTYDLNEAFLGSPTIDKERGIIKDVVILTGNKVSRNKTLYTDSALNEAAQRYNGAKMYLDHPKQGETNRSIRDFGGVYNNVRREGNQIKGDLHVIESVRPHLFSIAEMRPKGVGLSIRDRGRGQEDTKGVFCVEGFKDGATHSIDFVTEVSVNSDLFESDNQGGDEMDYAKLTKENLLENRKDLVEAFRTEGKTEMVAKLEESNKLTDESKLFANKVLALAEAKISDDKIMKALRTMIESPTITLDQAKATIKAQVEILEAAAAVANKGKKPGTGEPDVTGIVPQKEVIENISDANDEDLAGRLVEAFKSGI